jgi:hypothetical protein
MGVFAYYPAFIQWFRVYSDLSLTVVILRESFASVILREPFAFPVILRYAQNDRKEAQNDRKRFRLFTNVVARLKPRNKRRP